jgi:hypothetical protein
VAVVLGLNGLYPDPDLVHAVLAPENGVTKRILDVGKAPHPLISLFYNAC